MSGSRITFLQGQADQPNALERVVAHVRGQFEGAGLERLRAAERPLFAGIGASYAALGVAVDLLRARGWSPSGCSPARSIGAPPGSTSMY
ncbi:hypothetical protein [Streptomyces sp. RKAG293]|uniref:hypothetical protein n=1 Tax=Streptomyces sp. RKAG293 TaxID=2893403 RepID=UPI002033AE5F|nr:hypothetical protein [Streptomyces sp. RKAG293]MCM2417896.1 hypothetical protein [Streptomyces sp. RKAG293]